MPYIGRSSNFGVRTRFLYTATASQTTFSGTDTQNLTLSYSDSNFIDVHQNGVLLKIVDDYTATSGTSVVLATGATASDVIEITVYDVFSIANHIKKTGDAMAGALTNIDIDGTELILDADGDTSITADTDDQIDIRIGGADDFAFKANKFEVQTGSNIDMNGQELIFDADGDTSIQASTDDIMVFDTAGSERMRIDAGGSVLIGQSTPTDLHNTWNHLIIGNRGSVISQNGAGGVDGMTVSYNAYIDADTGAYAYIATDEASILTQQNGILQYRNATSGTAGNAITFDTKLQIDADGHVTKPKQSAFLVGKSGAQDNLSANTTVTITFDSEIFDQNADFASNTFTAPVTGRYYLQFRFNLGSTDADSTNFQSQIATSNRTYSFNFDPSAFDKDTGSYTANGSTLADMDANDTCTFRIYQSGGLDQVDVSSSSTVSGFLAC